MDSGEDGRNLLLDILDIIPDGINLRLDALYVLLAGRHPLGEGLNGRIDRSHLRRYPAEVAAVWQTALSMSAVYTITKASPETVALTVESVSAENGFLSVTVSGRNLKDAYFQNKCSANVRLSISDGNNDLTSEYIQMVPWTTDNIYIPDANFKTYLLNEFDKDGDGEISQDEAEPVKEINVSASLLQIKSLSGIEYFTNLEKLDCSYNRLTTLDLSNNMKLVEVNAGSNRLESLNLAGCTGLKSLDCSGNRLQTIDISIAKNLETLTCANNKLVKLDVSQNKALKSIDCSGNTLAALALGNIVPLESLNVSGNQLTSLDLTKNVNLMTLDCHDNALASLLVSKCLELTTLNCSGNKLTSLYAGGFTKLTDLDCHGNELVSLGVNGCDVLKTLDCSDNSLVTLDVVKNTALTSVDCSRNRLGQLNVSTLSSLRTLDCSSNADMNRLWVKDTAHQLSIAITKEDATMICYNNGGVQFEDAALKAYLVNNYDDDGDGEISIIEAENITNVNCSGKGVSSLAGLEACANLETLDCSNNSISTIRLPRLTKLETLRCFGNPISELDLTGCITFRHCYMKDANTDAIQARKSVPTKEFSLLDYTSSANSFKLSFAGIPHITLIKISKTNYVSIDISDNDYVTDVDITNNANLTSVDLCHSIVVMLLAGNRKLENVDVSALTLIEDLHVHMNYLHSLDVSKNVNLKTLYCFDNDLSTLDVQNNTALEKLNASGNKLTLLNLTKNTMLKDIDVSGNDLVGINVRNCPLLETLNVSGNANISVLNVDKNPELTTLNASGLGISELDLTKNEKMFDLSVKDNAALKLVKFILEEDAIKMNGFVFNHNSDLKFVNQANKEINVPVKIDNLSWLRYNIGYSETDKYGSLYTFSQVKCPSGWRLPTDGELSSLSAHSSDFTTFDGMKGRWFSGSNAYSESVSAIFLPAAGSRGGSRDSSGYYRSSTEYNSYSVYNLYFNSSRVGMEHNDRSYSFSVRCVKD